jgi:hypothetical protein
MGQERSFLNVLKNNVVGRDKIIFSETEFRALDLSRENSFDGE